MFTNLVNFMRVWIAISLLILAPILDDAPGFSTEPPDRAAIGSENGDCVPIGAEAKAEPTVRGVSFHFLDHELAYAGGYGLQPLAGIPDEAELDVFDHELAYAGGYGLRPLPGIVSGVEFDFVDHELAHAGGYGLRRVPGVVAGPDFDFLDHELRYARGYGLCATALVGR